MDEKTLARFEAKYQVEPNTGCWLWLGTINRGGYGRFTIGRRGVTAHRMVYEHHRGPIPLGLVLDHLCRQRCCVNPDHLEAVTTLENIRRGTQGDLQRTRTHCPQGHAYDAANTGHSSGRVNRFCRACKRHKWHLYQPSRRPRSGQHQEPR